MHNNYQNSGYNYGQGNFVPAQGQQMYSGQQTNPPYQQYQQYYSQFQQPQNPQYPPVQQQPQHQQVSNQAPAGRQNNQGKFRGKQNFKKSGKQQQNFNQNQNSAYQQRDQVPHYQQQNAVQPFNPPNQMYHSPIHQQQNNPQAISPQKQTNNQQQQFNQPNFGNKNKQQGNARGKQSFDGVAPKILQNAYPQPNYVEPPLPNTFQISENFAADPGEQNFLQNTYGGCTSSNQFTSSGNVTGFDYQGYHAQPPLPPQQQHTEPTKINQKVVKKNEGKGASSTISKAPCLNTFVNQPNQPIPGNSAANVSYQYSVPVASYQQVDLIHQMQAEKSEFDLQFERWEKEFAEWKKINANHPDRTAYAKYAEEFEKVRQQLLKRREEMRLKTVTTAPPPPPDPVKDAQRANFANQWNSSSDVNSPSTSNSGQPLSSGGFSFNQSLNQFATSQVDFQNDSVEIFENFGETFRSKTENLESLFSSNRSAIPFLESAVPLEKPKPPVVRDPDVPIVDLEKNEENEKNDNFEFPPEKTLTTSDPPPLPVFTVENETREIIDIRKLLDPPARYDRFDKIVIFIRGAPGSGKTHLARLIMERERKILNNRSRFLSIHKYTRRWPFDRTNIYKYQDSLLEELKNVLKSRQFNFVIVEVEGFAFPYMKKLASIVGGCQFRAYIIELHQPIEICRKYNINERSFDDIENAVNGLILPQNRPPIKMCAIDPTIILDPDFKGTIPKEKVTASEQTKSTESLDPTISNFDFSKILQNKNVLELVQSQIKTTNNASKSPDDAEVSQTQPQVFQQTAPSAPNHNQMQYPPINHQHFSNQGNQAPYPPNNQDTMQIEGPNQQFNFTQQPQHQHFNQQQQQMQQQRPSQIIPHSVAEIPIYVPKKTVDYSHKNIETLHDQMMEFKIFRVIDYKYKTTRSLFEFIKDVDLDKIVEKKKTILLRRKTLAYLKNAERPEDTVSNPKYPKNWESINTVERPASKTKRGKRKTAKILRIIARRNPRPKLNLKKLEEMTEDISDDEEVMNKIAIVEVEDETKNWTIPKFKQPDREMQSIKEILNYPARLVRPRQILMILRGAPGSGKSHLAQLIKRKEKEMQNENLRILSINDYYESNIESDDEGPSEHSVTKPMVDKFLDQMMKQLERTIKDEFNFIIIDAENCDLKYYNLFYLLGMRKLYSVFTIELHQTPEICIKQNKMSKFWRSENEIKEAIQMLHSNRTPTNHNLIDPTSIYQEYKCVVNAKVKSMMDLEEVSDDEKFSDDEMFEELPDDPRIPNFNWHLRQKNYKNMKDLLEEPGRKKRPEKIMIILRGPPGSGKSYLSGLIRSREMENGAGDKFMALSIDDYFIDKMSLSYKYNVYAVPENQKAMIRSLKEIIRKNVHKFIVIDTENGTLEEYNQYYSIGSSSGYRCYAVELHQSISICKSQNIHERLPRDMENVLDDMKLNPLPDNHILLNPSYIYSMGGLESGLPAVPEAPQPPIDFLTRCKLPLIIDGDIVKVEKRKVKLPEFNWHNRDTIEIQSVFGNKSNELIFLVLRGAPGSGKTYLASLIAQSQMAQGVDEDFVVVSLDEQFSCIEEKNSQKYLKYEYKSDQYDVYVEKSVKNFEEIVKKKEKKFVVIDADNCELKYYKKFYEVGTSNGYSGYTIELNQDEDICLLCNDHRINESEIRVKIKLLNDNPIDADHKLIDPEYLYHSEEFESCSEDEEFESSFGPLKNNSIASKWDDVDQQDMVINKLDGTKNKSFTKLTMADYLKTEDEWTMRPSMSGKKRVRWADIEEKKNQERMREVGFIVGQTDWSRMTDTSDGRNALEKTRYIEPRNK